MVLVVARKHPLLPRTIPVRLSSYEKRILTEVLRGYAAEKSLKIHGTMTYHGLMKARTRVLGKLGATSLGDALAVVNSWRQAVGWDPLVVEVAEAGRLILYVERPLLTERQREVLRAAADGLDQRQMGEKLGIRPQTVKNHLTVIYAKLGVYNITGAVACGFRAGWLR